MLLGRVAAREAHLLFCASILEEAYQTRIYSRLADHTVPSIAVALGVTEAYAADIRSGRHRPHPRHWGALAKLVGVSPDQNKHQDVKQL